MSVLFVEACVSIEDRARENMRLGQIEYKNGNVLAAYRLLRDPDMKKASLGPGYSKLLKQVTQAAEYLIEKWLEKGDFWRKQGDLPKALHYYSDAVDQLPKKDPLRRQLVFKARLLDERLSYVKKEISSLVFQGQQSFTKGRYKQARDKLLEARWKAIENNLTFAIENERLIEECNRRSPSEFDLDFGEIQDVASSPVPNKLGIFPDPYEESRRAHRKKYRSSKTRKKPVKVTEIRKEDDRYFQLSQLLLKGRQQMHSRKYLKAIITFRKVLAIVPDQTEAQRSLKKLEPIQKQLVADLMKKANYYFAREDLEKAAPFYLQVLSLDPGNLRAKEGLQMYKHLKELKKKKR
ncbi:MAG: hypothetical protein JRJ87_16425 [Deltaproteobacteria bacterium]|nr:hypothetical protein [Deltaproteobacteria bacterium]